MCNAIYCLQHIPFFDALCKVSAREQMTGTLNFVDMHLMGHYVAFHYFVLASPYNSAALIYFQSYKGWFFFLLKRIFLTAALMSSKCDGVQTQHFAHVGILQNKYIAISHKQIHTIFIQAMMQICKLQKTTLTNVIINRNICNILMSMYIRAYPWRVDNFFARNMLKINYWMPLE